MVFKIYVVRSGMAPYGEDAIKKSLTPFFETRLVGASLDPASLVGRCSERTLCPGSETRCFQTVQLRVFLLSPDMCLAN